MKSRITRSSTGMLALLMAASVISGCNESNTSNGPFNIDKDLLLAQYDCKTDVDDLHSVAALVTLLSDPQYSGISWHAVAGTYGIQEGLYVPPNELFQLAFGNNWTDAHANVDTAVDRVKAIVMKKLSEGGDVWIAEAGQSDFTARLLKSILADAPETDLTTRVHVVQHSDWNEEVTTPDLLEFVKTHTDYHKIPDGNAVGNGTPGFRTPDFSGVSDRITNPRLKEIWQLAITLGNQYNGADGRYNNEAVQQGGVDFSDTSEVCWMLGLQDIKGAEEFFDRYGK